MRNRAAKRKISKALAGDLPEFQAPKLRRAAIAERGTAVMTRVEFITHRIHGQREAWIARELMNGRRRYRRRPVRVA